MKPEVTALAASGASTLVALMATDNWTAVRTRVAGLFGRAQQQAAEVEAELEASHRELINARRGGEQAIIAEIDTEWQRRFRRLLKNDPVAVAALRQLLAEVTAVRNPTVTHAAISGVVDGAVVRTETVRGDAHFR